MADLADEILNKKKYLLPIHRAIDGSELAILDQLITDDFIEFGASGKIFTKANLLAYAQEKKFNQSTIAIENFQIISLVNNIVLATYKAVKTIELARTTISSHRSSIWQFDADQEWRIRFHQGTPC